MRVRLRIQRLQQVIAHSPLSRNHWAIKIGISRGHWSDILNGKHLYLSARTRDRLLEEIGLTFDELFEIEADAVATDHPERALTDRYVIDGELGRGGMGTVFLAREIKHGRPVAIKLVTPEAVSGIGLDRFFREIGYNARLHHPHILALLDSGVAGGHPYYVMPLVREGSLRDLLDRDRRLPVAEALPIVRGIAAALAFAHRHGVVHCDVKPQNVLLAEGHAYVADFGIARAIHLEYFEWGDVTRDQLDSSAGTPAYVSPEQAHGERDLDGRSDLYSLGCLVYEMLAGTAPFAGRTTVETVARRFTGPTPDLRAAAPHVPAGVAHAVERALALRPAERQEGVQAFWRELEAAAIREGSFLGRVHARVTRGAWTVGRRARLRVPPLPAWPRRLAHRLEAAWQDVRVSLRGLRRSPGFALIAILTLALGIGANLTMFGLVNAVLLRPLPYPASDRLVQITEVSDDGREMSVAGVNFLDWRDQVRAFSGLAVYPSLRFVTPSTVLGGDRPERVQVLSVSRDFLTVMGRPPAMGRGFVAAEFEPAGPAVAVISERFWRTSLGAAPDLASRPLRMFGTTYQVVGVMPAGFHFPDDTDVWLPSRLSRQDAGDRTSHNFIVVGRLRDGVSLDRARRDLSTIAERLKAELGSEVDAAGVRVVSLRDAVAGSARRPLLLLLGSGAVLLLIACTNIATGTLGRGAARRQEVAVRIGIGAGRGRLIGQLFTESLVLSALGTAVGIVGALLAVRVVRWFGPGVVPRLSEVTVDLRTAAFTVGVTVATAVLFGLLPAFRASRVDVVEALRGGGRGHTGPRREWVWPALIAAQAALAVVLLTGAGLVLRSFHAVMDVDPGFRPAGVTSVALEVPDATYPDGPAVAGYLEQAVAALATVAGVRAAGVVSHPPLAGVNLNGSFDFEGQPEGTGYADYRVASGGYFRALGIPVVQGRLFDDGDRAGTPDVALVNRAFAQAYGRGENLVGTRIRSLANDRHLYGDRWITIVGVVGDIRQRDLTAAPVPAIYLAFRQRPGRIRSATLVAASGTSAPPSAAAVRDGLALDSEVPATVSPMVSFISHSVAMRRFSMLVLAGFATAALALAVVGIHGVVSYGVARRAREVGIRVALGARPRAIRWLMMRDALAAVGAGLILGIIAAWGGTRLLRSVLFGVSPTDPLTFAAVVGLLLATAWIASSLPAGRSTRLDPMRVMRGE